jgi:hypothetical protein
VAYSLTIPLLQPIPATTPLAALLNRWLLALAPAAALISANHPSEIRAYLYETTVGCHFYHRTVGKLIDRLENGKSLKTLSPVLRFRRDRMSVACPILDERVPLALAMRGAELTDARQVYKYPGYLFPHLDKLIAQGGPFSEDCALLRALFAGGARAVQELDNPLNEANREADALAIFHCVMDADAEGLRALEAATNLRDGIDPWPWKRPRRKLPQEALAYSVNTCQCVGNTRN